MANEVRKKSVKRMSFTVILLCSCIFLFTGCFDFLDSTQIRKKIMEVQKCIKERDKDKLFEYFAEDIRNKNKEETMKDIESFFEHIDGKMVFYDYNEGGSIVSAAEGETVYYTCRPEIYLKTDTGQKYVILLYYNHIWKKHPEREGIETICLIEGEKVDLSNKQKVHKFGKTVPYAEDT